MLGLSFLTKFFRNTIIDSWHIFTLITSGGEYDAGVYNTHREQTAYNLNLVSSTWAEVKVGKGMLSLAESHQKIVTSKQSNFIKSRKL
jgi:hypothetical protein